MLVLWLIIWIGCAIWCAAIAAGKHRSATGWFLLGLLFGVFALLFIAVAGDMRPQTIIIQQAAAAPPPSPPSVDAPRRGGWPGSEPRLLNAPVRAARAVDPEPGRHYLDLTEPVTALLVLAQAGERGLDQRIIDAIMTYLEAENGATDYSRREAQQILDWMHALPADEASIRAAVTALPKAIGDLAAFQSAMNSIAGPEPSTERQGRWLTALRRRVGA